MFQTFYSYEKPISRRMRYSLTWSVILLQHFIIQCLLYYLSSGSLREVKNKREFQTFRLKSGRGRLQEVPNIVI